MSLAPTGTSNVPWARNSGPLFLQHGSRGRPSPSQAEILALYRRYQQEGDAFKPGYFRLLSYGGSARPEKILGELGIDMADADFWQGGFDVVGDMLAELKSIETP